MEYSLLIIFYYGMLHALGVDHLSAIALFSIGKHKKEVVFLTILFAVTHGLILYIMALFVQYFVDDSLFKYGDIISSLVILYMGLYLCYLTFTNQITFDTHTYQEQTHRHVYYKHTHRHDQGVLFTLGILMGVGGLRGMLITLGVVSHHAVGVKMILFFVFGVIVVFFIFGYVVYFVNTRISYSSYLLRYSLMFVGVLTAAISVVRLNEVFHVT